MLFKELSILAVTVASVLATDSCTSPGGNCPPWFGQGCCDQLVCNFYNGGHWLCEPRSHNPADGPLFPPKNECNPEGMDCVVWPCCKGLYCKKKSGYDYSCEKTE